MSYYCPLDNYFKKPAGAVRDDTPVRFRLRFPQHFSIVRAEMLVTFGSAAVRLQMVPSAREAGNDVFELRHVFSTPGIYTYRFEAFNCYGQLVPVARGPRFEGQIDGSLPPFQQTVYMNDYKTPDFLKGGVLYQIFPDRFYKSGKEKADVPYGRELRGDWGGMPRYLPDKNGKILNNDYFGGDLQGIEEKLPYLHDLGVTCLYLNPIFEAHSNHRYNTANYERVDPLLGTNEDFTGLCKKAKALGISIILDGVFSHTGDDSIYFNRQGRYGENTGAFRDWNSPYRPWFQFERYPDRYKSWWGIETLPELDESNQDYKNYITGENGIAAQWLARGASGLRLDVADELPDDFLFSLRESVKRQDPETLIIGEVWEDASTKESYGVLRPYLLGRQLDSVMNYPFKNAVLDFFLAGDPLLLEERLLTILQNYPKPTVDVLMNFLSTHDVERAITRLAGDNLFTADRSLQAGHALTTEQYEKGKRLLKLAYTLLFFLPGIPSVYYGDEIGMQGYRDPFNRGCFTWDAIDEDLHDTVQFLAKTRAATPCLREGDFYTASIAGGCFAFERSDDTGSLLVFINPTEHMTPFQLERRFADGEVLAGRVQDGWLDTSAFSASIIRTKIPHRRTETWI